MRVLCETMNNFLQLVAHLPVILGVVTLFQPVPKTGLAGCDQKCNFPTKCTALDLFAFVARTT